MEFDSDVESELDSEVESEFDSDVESELDSDVDPKFESESSLEIAAPIPPMPATPNAQGKILPLTDEPPKANSTSTDSIGWYSIVAAILFVASVNSAQYN